MDNVQPINGYISFNAAQKLKYGAFKSMREGRINIIGQCPFPATTGGTAPVALKQPYMDNPGTMDADSSSAILTLSLSPDDQVRELAADALSTQWANSLLRDVYDFISEYQKQTDTICPMEIPVFRFVAAGLAVTSFPGATSDNKEVFLVEELIQHEDGPWRKYINNNSSCPCYFSDNEDRQRAEFLAFCQHVQYWRTSCQVFTSDFQGGNTLLTDLQIITHPDLGGKLFSRGNIQRTHRNFEKEHKCNTFCKFFEVPTTYSGISESIDHDSNPVRPIHVL
ncbi:hypothetical protein EDB84DRAFT_1545639 [Lactarius hengduanensis]|nr:hypothetical protein EDB84DRAFT_1545639 [Lactarius hengduanensis]